MSRWWAGVAGWGTARASGTFLIGLLGATVPNTGAPVAGVAGGVQLDLDMPTLVGDVPPGTSFLTDAVQIPTGVQLEAVIGFVAGQDFSGGPGLDARLWVTSAAVDHDTFVDVNPLDEIATAEILTLLPSSPDGWLVYVEAYNDTGATKDVTDGFIQVYWIT